MKQLIKAVSLLLSLTFLPHAQVWADATTDAQAQVQQTTEKMLSSLKTNKDALKSNPSAVYPLVDEIVLPIFDFERMSRLVLGKNWQGMNESQQKRFVEEFRSLLVRTYSAALIEAAASSIDVNYLPVRAENDAKRLTIRTKVNYGGKAPVSLDYDMFLNNDNQWKVYNVSAEGVSLVTNYRSEFETDINTIGVDKLIEKIASRNQTSNKPNS
ncbi:ABC-type transport system involved in resistance to organic solvents, auxiliary component [Beggiatoa alba B18LD]|uniref:ABC-type transport system involved in resistance to organic solvents, auxiliary component n=1 Tax=Beggiatoa alba B18LD TaxID=395493 RepID=I3CG88_9GAMM|nr:ABC transporter substrate-binding protein [Beggiatoa alba]EIJ42631.1 ABC-type transport system involved in resistance to organic solvents, auxiliary component [Beggiatoa alba B18LD]